ncbi:hypothetical protein GCM10011574_51030 [Microbispora bryophytorum]|uniref:Uncharacterized protein n=1 Tax=Microbispora bryophytorum TaxID=1460882 RepID=A0A8H9H2F2_9ACTN|nr:hypothetical protein GCM10011574_51030 [Microbispora bryophytorum]
MLENKPDRHKRGVTTQYGPQTLGREVSDKERATGSHTADSRAGDSRAVEGEGRAEAQT